MRKSFVISAGNPSLRKDNIFNVLVPKTCVMGLVESGEFENTIHIDAERNVIYDYSG